MVPPNNDSPPRRPLAPPPRPSTLRDRLPSVPEEDPQEALLRAAKAEVDDAKAEAARERAARLDAEQRLSSGAFPPKIVEAAHQLAAQTKVETDVQVDSKGISAHTRWGRLAIGGGAIAALVAPLVAAGQHFLALERQVSAQTALIAGYQGQLTGLETKIGAQSERITELTTTVARLSGYLAGVLPAAGVNVAGAEPGAAAVKVDVAPLPLGARGRPQVRVRTLVPAPGKP